MRGVALLALALVACLMSQRQASASGEPTNTPVVDVLPYPTSTPLPTATIGETWTWPPPVLWLPSIMR